MRREPVTDALEIRAYATTDRLPVVQLVTEVLAEHGFALTTGGIEQDLAEAHERYDGARAGFWVAVVDARVVGTVAVRPTTDGSCELKRLYLHPDLRGSGVGQRLYAHAEAFARGAGYGRICIESSRRFARAHKLYERNGFVLLEELENDWEDNVYEKRLAAP